MIAGRYRVINLLGKGGMGEVYRAEDLTLEQEVALKFLPEAVSDEETLTRFRNEVRIARKISHPNVCRVYDIGEAENSIFLSMEYIDGEDLGSLLRRIGRLPQDKALEIGRKICAGLAAAHGQGVLHRDLKPANVMLNGRGEVLITDFGLAGVAHEINDIRSGTPAYMAPEQLSGKEVTARSDVYSLGLVLYEVFTGKRAFDGKTYDEILQTRVNTPPSRPSSIVKDLDPVVERAILRCLEPDPTLRPATALAVAAALPGGDPLAAALAAGETPSPELVAAAGEKIGLRVRPAMTWFAVAIVGLITYYLVGTKTSGLDYINTPYTPEVLSQKARDIVQQLGYPKPVDSAEWIDYDGDFLKYTTNKRIEWKALLGSGSPTLMYFDRRESPGPLLALMPKDQSLLPGIVDSNDPPPVKSGMINIRVDMQGKLYYFSAIPPQKDESPAPAEPFDWKQLFSLAGFDISQFKPAAPVWNSLSSSDMRAAWTGNWPGTSFPLRVEAAAYKGRPVFFALRSEWTRPTRMESVSESRSQRTSNLVYTIIAVLVVTSAALIAWRNFKLGKSDLKGTYHLGIFVFGIQMVLWIFRVHFVISVGLMGESLLAIGSSILIALLVCMIYMAIEPYVRRHWPQAIISWSRLISGKMRDPHVGRDLLYGVLFGLSWGVLLEGTWLMELHYGRAPQLGQSELLLGLRSTLATCLSRISGSVQGTLQLFFVMFVLRILVRKSWLAAILFVALFAGMQSINADNLMVSIPLNVAIYGIAALIVLRFGLVSLATGIFVANVILNVPITTNTSNWYFTNNIAVLGLFAAMAAWGCYTSLGGQKILGEKVWE
jgi:serine/threonine-protein kinase